MIKAVVFDLGEVLVAWRTPFQSFLNRFGIDLDQALEQCKEIIIEAELGKLDTDDLCRKMMTKLGYPDQWLGLSQIMPAGFIPRREIFALIKELQGKYRLALLTNAETGQVEAMDRLWHFKKYFEVVADSSKLGIRKPDVRIFKFVLRRLVLGPNECLYIDDVKTNIETAKKLGFQAVHFTDPVSSVKLIRKILHESI